MQATRATTTSSPTSRRSWRSAWRSRSREGVPEERIQLDPGIGFGKTARAQPRAAAAPDEIVGPRPPARRRHIAQVVPRPHHGPRRRPSACHGTIATNVLALERGAQRLPRPRRRRRRRRARGSGCYGRAPMADDEPETTTTTADDDDEETGPEVGVTDRDRRALALHPPRRHRRRARDRPAAGARRPLRRRRARRADHRPRRGHRRLRRGLPGDRAGRPAALLQDARAAVRGDRRPAGSQFGAESVTVKASKPEPPIPLPVEEVSVEVWREER